ncbi:MAG: PepSY domain-containing protein [Candidatus Thiodiazotropha sp. (ex Epidulcina cf. delphinae)]|nr:PepSY domain-containing protein [Candidatus Thiodiazotropha sp. (ex Epidulcina cf. delphinae)]
MFHESKVVLFLVPLISGVLLLPLQSTADHPEWEDENNSHDQARRAVNRGDAMTLTRVIEHLRRIAPGQIVAVEYEHEFDRWVYEFKIIDTQGRLQKVHLDARSGELIQMADD